MSNKPCPFCGDTDTFLNVSVCSRDREGVPVSMACEGCGAIGPWEYAADAPGVQWAIAEKEWNKRAPIDKLIEKLKTKAKECRELAESCPNLAVRLGNMAEASAYETVVKMLEEM